MKISLKITVRFRLALPRFCIRGKLVPLIKGCHPRQTSGLIGKRESYFSAEAQLVILQTQPTRQRNYFYKKYIVYHQVIN